MVLNMGLYRPIATNKRHRLWDDRHRRQETCRCPAFPSHLAGEWRVCDLRLLLEFNQFCLITKYLLDKKHV
jgi:hypothetical protein